MKLSLTVDINNEKIVIVSADGSVRNTFPNLVGLDENDKFVSIGKTPEEIQKQAPQEWEKVKDKIHFCNLFSLNSFRPELAASTIEYLVYLTTHPTPKSQWSLITDSTELHLKIPEYEKLSANARDLFEFCVQEVSLIKVKSLSINSQARSLSKIRLAKQMAKFGLPASFIFVFLLVSSLLLALLGERYSIIPEDEKWSFLIVFMVVLFFVLYLASFIFVISWKFATRNLISDSISRKIIEGNKVGLPKPLMNLIWQKLPSKIGGG